jgi:hypothetical protein
MYVHGMNLQQKENHKTKYQDAESKKYLAEIRVEYDKWRIANEKLLGPFIKPSDTDEAIIEQRVKLFSDYKDFIDQKHYAEKFDSRSNLHSSVLEEFMYYLFRDLVKDFSENALIGKASTYKDLFFVHSNYREMVSKPGAQIEEKDHDFIIGVNIEANFNTLGSTINERHNFKIPAVAIECKTYLDKTMLEGSSNAASQLKTANPNAIYIVVMEWLKLTEKINLQKYEVDQIYVLRKQKNTDREYRYLDTYEKNPIYLDVVVHLFNMVRNHLTRDWEGGVNYGLQRGYLL